MELQLPAGRYVVAVSGGVDSVVLLHLLSKEYVPRRDEYRFVVAHYDHGIREDSAEDRAHVQELAQQYGLPYVFDEGQLGAGASEAAAREARYAFLHSVRKASKASAVITAHHQDDVLETAVLNLLRGTGRRGVASLKSTDTVVRPLLHVPKKDLREHAQAHGLTWREDSTNQDEGYKRNYVRHRVLSKLQPQQRSRLVDIIKQTHQVNQELDNLLVTQLHLQSKAGEIDRRYFIMLPHNVARELMAFWLREHGIRSFDSKTLERLVRIAKTFPPGKKADIIQGAVLIIKKDRFALEKQR